MKIRPVSDGAKQAFQYISHLLAGDTPSRPAVFSCLLDDVEVDCLVAVTRDGSDYLIRPLAVLVDNTLADRLRDDDGRIPTAEKGKQDGQ